MASPAGTKPLSRQERRNQERQKAQDQARKATKSGQTEDKQRRRLRDAAAQQDRRAGGRGTPAASPASRHGPRIDPRTMIDGMNPHLADEPTTLSLARHLETLGLGVDTAVGPLLHTLEAERDLIAAANDIGRQAAAKLPAYFSFFTKWRGRCVDMTAAAGGGSREGSGKGRVMGNRMPPILQTKDPQLLPGMKHCQMNLEATVELWTVMLSRIEESLNHWQRRSGAPFKNVVEDQAEMELRMDLESAKTRVMYSIQHMQAALDEAMEMIEGVERGQGEGLGKTAIAEGQRMGSDKRLPGQIRRAEKRPTEGVGRSRN